jgi:hypothetical protein
MPARLRVLEAASLTGATAPGDGLTVMRGAYCQRQRSVPAVGLRLHQRGQAVNDNYFFAGKE